MAKLTDKLKQPSAPLQPKREAVWKGPESGDKNGGVTFSLLSRFLVCRERFRLYAVEGLKPKDSFNANIEYGNFWHQSEEALSANKPWKDAALQYGRMLATKYPFSREEIDHWLRMCLTQFPEYVEYWKQHPDVEDRTPLLQEQVFDVAYKLPSGRTVRLRGKWDAVDLVGVGKSSGIYIQENKTKSQIDQVKISRQLSCDLQSMMYTVALKEVANTIGKPLSKAVPDLQHPIKGVRYNVIRRSAHKTPESMYKKMTEDIADNRGNEWFSRWKIDIRAKDIENFKTRTLNPILEQLCYWYDWMTMEDGPKSPKDKLRMFGYPDPHWQHPFGVYNVLDEGGSSDLDAYIETGSEVGLQRVTTMFQELNSDS